MEQPATLLAGTSPQTFQTLYGILEGLPIAVSWATMPGAVIQFQNKAFDRLFGYPHGAFHTADEFVDKTYLHEHQRAMARERWSHFRLLKTTGVTEIPDMELDIRRFDGETRTLRHCGIILHDIQVGIAIFEDISEQKRLYTMLSSLAHLDPLTGLANRRRLEERFQEEATRNAGRRPMAFLMMDLDGFKHVNDTYGHDAGDAVLRIVASRLKALVRENDLVYRLGGDEFGILLPAPENKAQVEAICRRVVASVRKPMTVDGIQVQVGASVGTCLYPEQASDLRELLQRADHALYEVKRAGKGGWGWCVPGPV